LPLVSDPLVTQRAGLTSIPVYGRAHPEDISVATLGYTIAAGQVYVAKDLVGADYYDATTFDALDTYQVCLPARRGSTRSPSTTDSPSSRRATSR
jgi:hypothetical protein